MGKREGAMEGLVSPWQGRRVFLTGHTGFKGSWLALWLASKGAVIRGYSLDPPSQPNLFTTASVATVVEDIRGDIRDYPKLSASLAEFAPEVVFHLAAQPLVRRSYADPLETYSTNVLGTVHVLEAVRRSAGVRAVVSVTTDKCYENKEWIWPYRETDSLGGHDPYSSSKACAEIVTAAYRSSYFQNQGETQALIATARAGNVIGGGDWSEDRLIPDLLRGLEANQPIMIRHPKAIRPWQHVLDPLCGYILLAEQLLARHTHAASSFNFGPEEIELWPVERIADTVTRLWGRGASWVSDDAPTVHEAQTLRLDASKAHAELGWRPRLATRQAVEWTMQWHQAWLTGGDMGSITRGQIASYEELLG